MKTALVTGASCGIGHELTLICANNGHNLVLSARNEAKLEDINKNLEAEYKIKVHLFPADLSAVGKPKELYDYLP